MRCRLGRQLPGHRHRGWDGPLIARHALAPDGAGVMVRDHGHVSPWNVRRWPRPPPPPPHRPQAAHPTGPAARAAADALRAAAGTTADSRAAGRSVTVIDLARYAAAASGRNTLT